MAQYHNCLHKPLINVEPNLVAPPYLHILLGIALKHHRLLEDAPNEIDRQLALSEINCKLFWAKGNAYWSNEDPMCTDEDTLDYEKIVNDLEDQLYDLENEPYPLRTGPICSEFDTILNKHNITPQAYHSRSFIDNHYHKYITAKVVRELTALVIHETNSFSI